MTFDPEISQKSRKIKTKNFIIKNIAILTAISTLITAYIIGLTQKNIQVLMRLQEFFPEEIEFYEIDENPLLLEAHYKKSRDFLGYLAVEKAQGWGGPLQIATVIDSEGTIKETIVLDHKETPSFFYKIQRHRFFEQFIGKKASDPFILERDIDTVTQATISVKAITEAIRDGSHAVGKKILNLRVQEMQSAWKFGINEIILILLYAGVIINTIWKWKMLRYVIMATAFVFLGIHLNSAISIGNISQIILGYIPSIKDNLFWWILVGGALLMPLILKSNLYCSCLCPFGALQELTARISGINIRFSKKRAKLTRNLVFGLTWLALILIFLTSNPAVGSYEPFSTFFRLEGIGIQWFILPAVVLGSFLLKRFFCQFFCPVGVVLNLMIKARQHLNKFMTRSIK